MKKSNNVITYKKMFKKRKTPNKYYRMALKNTAQIQNRHRHLLNFTVPYNQDAHIYFSSKVT